MLRTWDWKQHFPYPAAREIQGQALSLLVENWNEFDVFVINAPTAFGKTALARTLMNALHGVSVITPTNMLVDQFRSEFPDTPTLSRLDSYWCEEWDRPCTATRGKLMNFCSSKTVDGGCPCSKDLAKAKYNRGPGIYNYHTYLAHKLYRPVIVVDEAHNLIPVIRDRLALKIWQHDYKYPANMRSTAQIREWIKGLSPAQKKHKKIQILREAVWSREPAYMPQRTTDVFNGKGTLRGQPEERDCIKLLPTDIASAPPLFWPKEVEKVILLSATIGPKDLEALGLEGGGRRKVCYIDCKSPIPSTSRPIIPLDTASVNRSNMMEVIPKLAAEIVDIGAYHRAEKGVVHCTYQLAELLGPVLAASSEADRFIIHNRIDKKEKYSQFRNSESPKILLACGMYEGIDLPEDLGRWQVIAKIPWPSLGNPAIQHLAETDPDWYLWECMKTVIQACGRICRTPDDYGVTYILDSTFQKLYTDARHMVPDWYNDAIIFPEILK